MARFITKRSRANPFSSQAPQSSQISASALTQSANLDANQGKGKRNTKRSTLTEDSHDDELDHAAGCGSQAGHSDDSSGDNSGDSDGDNSNASGGESTESSEGHSDDDEDRYDDEDEDDEDDDDEYEESYKDDAGKDEQNSAFQDCGNSRHSRYGKSSEHSDSSGSEVNRFDDDYVAENTTDPDWEDPDSFRSEFSDIIPDEQYHPEHHFVRSRIDGLYFDLANSREPYAFSSPYSIRTTNVQQLVDQLIRSHLPQFWRHRERDQALSRFSGMTPKNTRPHRNAMLATCVDCGFKFHKQPLYDSPATERYDQRKARKLVIRNSDDVKRRSPWKERKALRAVELFASLKGGPIQSDSFSRVDIDNILNNNRRAKDYDGNLDYIGLKEEGHPVDCPRNRSSKKHGTKLHFGWEIVLGHDHSGIPTFPNANADNCLMDKGPYYPVRSLLASFAHLLPRGQTLPQNQMRKLFTYFIWHRWFDCDIQAITIRKGYRELWPLFILRDEEQELTTEEVARFRRRNSSKGQIKHQNKKQKAVDGSTSSTADSQTSPSSSEQSSTDKSKRRATPEELAVKERARLLSMEQRFTTLFNIGLRNHGVHSESRHLSVQEQVRRAKEADRGWILGYSEYLGNNIQSLEDRGDGETGHKAKIIHKIFEYTARAKDTPTGFHPLIKYMTNSNFTRPDEPDALEALSRRFDQLSKRAEARREQLGFVMPEYMTPRTKSNKAAETKVNPNTKISLKRSRTMSFPVNEEDTSRSIKLPRVTNPTISAAPPAFTVPHHAPLVSQSDRDPTIVNSAQAPREDFSYLNVPSQARRNDEMLMENLSAVNYPFQAAFVTENEVPLSSSVTQNVRGQPSVSLETMHSQPQTGFLYNNPSVNACQGLDINAFLGFDNNGLSCFAVGPSSGPSTAFNQNTIPTMHPHHVEISEANISTVIESKPASNTVSAAGSRKGDDTETDAGAGDNH
ncbi:hypothetical protein BGX21_002930 [Mortierella sp. AD011]|nr:hypothetical protein BGX20_006386 [Mortierella sp. AD010]KAF9401024.1 hypothetical protein BGX21_002930 [Mortierella sp. AD011]